jgi:outer membrane receptor protein involved in Fe transport
MSSRSFLFRQLRNAVFGLVGFSVIALTIMLSTRYAAADSVRPGWIMGKVIDAANGETIIGASVTIQGTTKGAASDLDGLFNIKDVPPGSYTLVASSIGYSKVVIENVQVVANEMILLNFAMPLKEIEGETVVVTGRALQNTEAVMLKHRHAARQVTDAISAEEISKSGAGDAAEAMTRVVGATVSGGKYVYIRGLGDRYSNTQLNGSMMPTPDPEKQAVPMDLISTSLLDNIVITKSFTPDKPGNFAGGSVDLITKDYPEYRTIAVSVSGGHNSQTTYNENFLTFEKGSLKIPEAWDSEFAQQLPNDIPMHTKNRAFADSLAWLFDSFDKNFNQAHKKVPFAGSVKASYGDVFQLFGRRLGLNSTLSYGGSANFYEDGIDARWRMIMGAEPELVIRSYLHDTRSIEEDLLGGLANISYSLRDNHKIGAVLIRNHGTETETRYLQGGQPDGFSIEQGDTASAQLQARVLSYKERDLNSVQLHGKHHLSPGFETRVNWQVSFSDADMDTPDLRYFNNKIQYLDSDGVPLAQPRYSMDPTEVDQPYRFFRKIDESNDEYKLDVIIPLGATTNFKSGFSALDKVREHRERYFKYAGTSIFTQVGGSIEAYLDTLGYRVQQYSATAPPLYIFDNLIEEATTPAEQYDARQDINAVYAMFELPVTQQLNLIGGTRLESTHMWVQNGFDRTTKDSVKYRSGLIEENDWLPSLNAVYHVGKQANIRAAYGRTLARPTFREFAPYFSYDYGSSGKGFNGNPGLKRSLIDNWDLRAEWFTRPAEILAVSGFYKKITNPIEIAVLSNNSDQIQPQNIDRATLYGIEFEIRKQLDILSPALSNFNAAANLTFVHSEVDIPEAELIRLRAFDAGAPDTREMRGQAPYVVNISLSYDNVRHGTSLNLQYNRVGKTFAINLGGGAPNVYEEPRDILDLIATKSIVAGVEIKLVGKNVLNAEMEKMYTYRDKKYYYEQYGIGRSISLGLSYTL